MLKTITSTANTVGSLEYKGLWNAATNTPTLVSSVGTQGDYYVVSVAGTTNSRRRNDLGRGRLGNLQRLCLAAIPRRSGRGFRNPDGIQLRRICR
jgi:hypothetical protein